jgi:hypothetical protein
MFGRSSHSLSSKAAGMLAVLATLVLAGGCDSQSAGLKADSVRVASSHASTATSGPGSASARPTTVSGPAPGAMSIVGSAPALAPNSVLNDIAVLDATHAWAVGGEGLSVPGGPGTAVVERWNGATWSLMPMTGVSWPAGVQLTHVAADSPTDVWVVGQYALKPFAAVTVVAHFDGTAWHNVPFPDGTPAATREITGISVADGHVFLVGNLQLEQPILDEWNGVAWQRQRLPPQCPSIFKGSGAHIAFCNFFAVKAFSPTDAWASGNGALAGVMHPLLFHWNGSSWNVVQPGVDTGLQVQLTAIVGTSPDDMWAVGNRVDKAATLVLHFNGATWSQVPWTSVSQVEGAAVDGTGRLVVAERSPYKDDVALYADGKWTYFPAKVPSGAIRLDIPGVAVLPGSGTLFVAGYSTSPTTGDAPNPHHAVIERLGIA